MIPTLRRHLGQIIQRFLGHPLIQRVMRNTGYLFSAQTISAALSMGQGILAARLLGVEGAGLVGIITQFASNINQLTSFRMGELVVSYVGEFSAKGKKVEAAAVFKVAALTEIVGSVLAYGLIVLLAPLGARIFAHRPELVGIITLYGLSVLGNLTVESATGLLQFFDRFRRLAVVTVGQSLLTILLIARAYLVDGTLEDVVLAYLAGKVVWGASITIIALVEARGQWGSGWWRVPVNSLRDRWRDLVRFGVSTNLSGTIKLLTRDSEMLWLGAFSTPLQVGFYKIAKAIVNILMMPITPLISTSYREVAREVASKQWANVRYLLRSGTILAAAWTLPAAAGLVIFGRWVVGLYGQEFLPVSYESLLILLVGVIAANILYWNQLILLPLGMPDYPTKVQFVVAIGKIAGTILLVPIMGANAMAMLFSGYLLLTSLILVGKSLREMQRVELQPATIAGD
jgi:O-antigen/teichoic acid export membrane protein